MPLTFESRPGPGATVVTCQGVLAFGSDLSEFAGHARQCLDAQPRLVLNLAAVTMVDSAGVGTLFGLHTSAQGAGGRLLIAAPSEPVRKVLDLTRMNTILAVCDSDDDAFRRLAVG